MNYLHLRAFHAVATHGSFTRAAAALNVTQPTVSDQIKVLENRYEVKLFERHSRRVALTELGRALYDVTRRQFKLEADAEQLMLTAKGLTHGRLRVAAGAPHLVIPLPSRILLNVFSDWRRGTGTNGCYLLPPGRRCRERQEVVSNLHETDI